jgi:hypothetical protein
VVWDLGQLKLVVDLVKFWVQLFRILSLMTSLLLLLLEGLLRSS